MAEVKWIKLSTNVFDNRKIRQIESMPEGDALVLIWFKLLCLAGKVNDRGAIRFTPSMPYTKEMLATEFNKPAGIIELALKTFEAFEMLEVMDDSTIFISGWEEHQNIDGMEKVREQNRLRKQKQRMALKDVSRDSHVTVTPSHATDIDIDIDKDIDNTITKVTTSNKVSTVAVVVEEKEKEKEERLAAAATTVQMWNQNIHPITPLEAEMLLDLIQECGELNVQKAIKKAVKANARNMGYVEGTAKGLLNGVDYDDIKPKQESFDEAVRMLQEKYEAEANGGNK